VEKFVSKTPEQRKGIIITALLLGAMALAFFVSAFFKDW
jgi:hypothetical protein